MVSQRTTPGQPANQKKEPIKKEPIKNPPPLTPPKVEPVSKEISKEEEDFSFLSPFNFSQSQVGRIVERFSRDEIDRALRILGTIKVKKSTFAALWDILTKPDNYSEKQEKVQNITRQQRLAHAHNQALFNQKDITEEVYNENIKKIKAEMPYTVGFRIVRTKHSETIFPETISCNINITEKQLREEIEKDIERRKK